MKNYLVTLTYIIIMQSSVDLVYS